MNNFSKLLSVIAVSAFTMFSASNAYAQRNPFNTLPYAYGHALELQGGWALNPYSYTGEAKTAFGVATGADFSVRYTYFPSRHWGFYAQLGGYSGDFRTPRFLSTVNRADGNKYVYDQRFWGDSDQSIAPVLTAGAVFRYDFGQWSLRPRVGVGIGQFDGGSTSFTRYERGNETGAPTYFTYNNSVRQYDYIAGSQYNAGNAGCFVSTASLQMTYTLRRHFFFSAEAGLNVAVKNVENTVTKYDSKEAYNPETWTEAVSWSNLRGQYEADSESAVTTTKNIPVLGAAFLKFGIGWNIGWNRNESNWYYRR